MKVANIYAQHVNISTFTEVPFQMSLQVPAATAVLLLLLLLPPLHSSHKDLTKFSSPRLGGMIRYDWPGDLHINERL